MLSARCKIRILFLKSNVFFHHLPLKSSFSITVLQYSHHSKEVIIILHHHFLSCHIHLASIISFIYFIHQKTLFFSFRYDCYHLCSSKPYSLHICLSLITKKSYEYYYVSFNFLKMTYLNPKIGLIISRISNSCFW